MYECVGCIHPGRMLKPLFNSTNKDWKNGIEYRASRYNRTLAHGRIRFRYTQIYSPTAALVAKDGRLRNYLSLTLLIIFIIIIMKAKTPNLTTIFQFSTENRFLYWLLPLWTHYKVNFWHTTYVGSIIKFWSKAYFFFSMSTLTIANSCNLESPISGWVIVHHQSMSRAVCYSGELNYFKELKSTPKRVILLPILTLESLNFL